MAWIESHQELRQHPKLKRLCRSLKCSPQMAVGLLHFLWWWAVDFAPDGSLHGYNAQDIADAIDWTEDANSLLKALTSAGFLDETPDALIIHDWPDHGAKTVNRQAAARERQRRWRAKQDAEAQSEAVLSTSNAHVTRDNGVSNAHVTRPHDMTGHDRTERELRKGSDEPPIDPLRDEPPPLPTTERSLVGYYMRTLSDHYNLPAATERYRGQVAGAIKTLLRTDGLTTEQVCAAIEGYLTTTDPAWQASANNGKPPPGLIRFAREMYAGNGSQPPGVAA